MIFIIKGGRRNGERIEADWKEKNKLFKKGHYTVQDVAADGSVMTSIVPDAELVFKAEKDEKIEELE